MKTPDRGVGPLYRHVANDIIAQVSKGRWKPGDRLPSEHGLCELYQVSQITVRRALRELAHEGRVYSHHGLGWFVSATAEGAHAAPEVTLVLPELNWLLSELVYYLSEDLTRAGVLLRLAFCDGTADGEATSVRLAVGRGTSALLVVVDGPERQLTQRYRRLVEGLSTPMMLVLREVDGLDAPTVALDESVCLSQMTRYVLDLGHRRIAYAGSDPAMVEGQRRYRGFAQTLWEQGLELPLDWVFTGDLVAELQARRFRYAFESNERPTALVCVSDLRAAEAMTLLGDMGLRCPEDVTIVGLGDRDLTQYLRTPLTTYRLDLAGLGRACAATALDLLGQRSTQSVRVSGELVKRQSCAQQITPPT